MVVLRASDLVSKGKMVIARHPFANPQMSRVAKALGKQVDSDEVVVRTPPPWSMKREYLYAMSPYQLQAIKWFSEINIELAKKYKDEPKYQRLLKRLLDLKGYKGRVSFGRTEKPKREGYRLAKRLLEQYKEEVPRPMAVATEGAGEMLEL